MSIEDDQFLATLEKWLRACEMAEENRVHPDIETNEEVDAWTSFVEHINKRMHQRFVDGLTVANNATKRILYAKLGEEYVEGESVYALIERLKQGDDK